MVCPIPDIALISGHNILNFTTASQCPYVNLNKTSTLEILFCRSRKLYRYFSDNVFVFSEWYLYACISYFSAFIQFWYGRCIKCYTIPACLFVVIKCIIINYKFYASRGSSLVCSSFYQLSCIGWGSNALLCLYIHLYYCWVNFIWKTK